MKISFRDFCIIDHAVRSTFSTGTPELQSWMEWISDCYGGIARPWTSDIPQGVVPAVVQALKVYDASLCGYMEQADEDGVAEAVNDVLYIRELQTSLASSL